jgi:uncharacterized delta-60 repeat protein
MKLTKATFICLLALTHTITYAQHGGLDNTFGTNGIVVTDLGFDVERSDGMTIQNDGKILLVGRADNGTNNDLILVRYNSDGTLDASFDGDGIASVDFAGEEQGDAVAVLPDGKIIVAGYRNESPNRNFFIFKFNSDGTVDMTFGTNGRVDIDFGATNDFVNNILVTPAGKIIVTGNSTNGSDTDFAVARVNADGTNDNTFGVLGKVTFDILPSDFCSSSVLQPDGKIVLFGNISLAGDIDFATIRCNEDGSLDNSFGVSGVKVTDFNGGTDRGYSVLLQPDGKIVAVGLANQGSTNADLGVVRYNPDGTLDGTFGVGGMISEVIGTGDYENDTYSVLQSDGKFVVAGTSTNSGFGDDITLVRLNSNGSLDNTFGSNGVVTTDIGTESNVTKSIALQADGKVLVGGHAFPDGTNSGDLVVCRYLSGLELGILDFSVEENSMLVYPNPINENVTLNYTLTNDETISIELYDVSGKLVQSLVASENRNKGPHTETLVLKSNIPSGTYVLTIGNGTGNSSVRLVK